ncbi:MAG: hypothetical protein J5486_08800 [Bacteroidaceae bacterium]|nr:hypothetical protein [Bacteroidaceae bacterium]
MKKFFLCMALIAIIPQITFADDTTVILNPVGPSLGNHNKPKSPINLSFLPTVTFNDETNVLTFEGNSDLGAVPYEVEDACENIVSSGVRYIYLNGTTTVSLGTLTTGTYTLYIIVGDNTYAGEFEVSAE